MSVDLSDSIGRFNLKYVYEEPPGIRRIRRGRGFSFINPDDAVIREPRARQRLLDIAVPPTYENVWYCPLDNGHLQATGYDSQDKKQYFYHERWRQIQEAKKFDMLADFGPKLPAFRRKITRAIDPDSLCRESVLAAMARLLDRTGIRIGNDLATQKNKTYGLTTLGKKQVETHGDTVELDFIGKGGQEIDLTFYEPKVAEMIDHCAEIPGQRLFQYLDEKEERHELHSHDLNNYIKEMIGEDFSAKVFRTWRFSCLFIEKALAAHEKNEKPTMKSILEEVAELSGNTPAILQSSYIHPGLLKAVKNGEWSHLDVPPKNIAGLRKAEIIFLNYLNTKHAAKALETYA
jgi:DNA topoisomerase-1